MKLLFFTGSRGEWGYLRPILEKCKKKKIKYNICATNMHLLSNFGKSIDEITRDGFKVTDKIYMALDGYDHFTMTKSLGVLISSFSDVIMRLKPDWIVIAGDRGETLGAAIVGAYTYTPVAHIQAGELSGSIDGMARHAIGKLSHLHFSASKDATQRLIKLGEEKFRIKQVGAPQLDDLNVILKNKNKDFLKKIGLEGIKNYILIIYHSNTDELEKLEKNFYELKKSLEKLPKNISKIWIMPNNDAGSVILNNLILNNSDNNTHIYKNLSRTIYLNLLKNCKFIIGNSSSGIIEAATFLVPSINLGNRQNKRLQNKNIINITREKEYLITKAIEKIITGKFQISKKIKNLYGDGKSSEKIINILLKTKINNKLLNKKITY